MPRTTVVAGAVATAALGNNFYQLANDQPINYLLNGGMEIWQRGTSGLAGATSATVGYTADRWQAYRTGFAAGLTASRATGGPTGARYALRIQRDSGNTSTAAMQVYQTLETAQAINLAGRQVTFSVYIRKGADFTGTITMRVIYGTGTDERITSTFVGQTTLISQTKTLTTGWVQHFVTGTLPSTASEIAVGFQYLNTAATAGANDYFEYSLAQLEIGTTPSPFAMNSGNIEGELSSCQRYYQRHGLVNGAFLAIGYGSGTTTTNTFWSISPAMRIAPTSVGFTNVELVDGAGGIIAVTGLALHNPTPTRAIVHVTHATNDTAHRPYGLRTTSAAGYVELNAEL